MVLNAAASIIGFCFDHIIAQNSQQVLFCAIKIELLILLLKSLYYYFLNESNPLPLSCLLLC